MGCISSCSCSTCRSYSSCASQIATLIRCGTLVPGASKANYWALDSGNNQIFNTNIGDVRVTRNLFVGEKLTVAGGIDPTYLELAGDLDDTYFNATGGSTVPVSAASQGRLRYNELLNRWEKSENGGAWAPFGTGGAGTIGGTIALNQVAFGTALDTIGGSANLTYDPAFSFLTLNGKLTGSNGSILFIKATDNGNPPNGAGLSLEAGDSTVAAGGGGLVRLIGGASAGILGQSGGVEIDAGNPNGGAPSIVLIAPNYASGIILGKDTTLSNVNIALNTTKSLRFNGLGDNTWQMGLNTGAYTKTHATSNSVDIAVGSGVLEGFTIGPAGGTAYLEVDDTGDFFFVSDLTTAGQVNGNSIFSTGLVSSTVNVLREIGANPPSPADTGLLYTKDVAGVTQLFYREDNSGAIYQLTPTGGAGTIGGTIAINQVAFGAGVDTIQGSANLLYDGTVITLVGDFNITGTVLSPAGVGAVGTPLFFQAGVGDNNFDGGYVEFDAGDGVGTGNGGPVVFVAGNSGVGATGNGGNISFSAGDSLAVNGNGGSVSLGCGEGSGTGQGGDLNLLGGSAGGALGTAGFGSLDAGPTLGGTAAQVFIGSTNASGVNLSRIAGAIGMFGATPVAQSTGWAVTNVTPDKTYDANATTVDELADVLGTLITYLISRGDLAA